MELKKYAKKISEYIGHYKYVVLIVAVGVLMLMIPFGEKKEVTIDPVNTPSKQELFEDRLCNILSCVSGAGNVKVMLSVMEGEKVVYQTDDNSSISSGSESNNIKTVTTTDSQRNQNGLIKQKIPETYKGVIIVCQGADDPAVRLNLINAVSKLTGLGADKISVLKMK